jgi:hypothetical protein
MRRRNSPPDTGRLHTLTNHLHQISDQPSPFADLEDPFAFSTIDIAKRRRMFQIGDRVLLIAN